MEAKIKLKGKGFPVYKNEGQFGDLYVTYAIKIPTNLTDKQKAYLPNYLNRNFKIVNNANRIFNSCR